MLGAGFFDERELNTSPLSEKELDELIGKRDYVSFLNARNELYRERDMKTKPPARAEALKLMAAQPNLIKRPLLKIGAQMLFGFDGEAWKRALERE